MVRVTVVVLTRATVPPPGVESQPGHGRADGPDRARGQGHREGRTRTPESVRGARCRSWWPGPPGSAPPFVGRRFVVGPPTAGVVLGGGRRSRYRREVHRGTAPHTW